MKTFEKLQSHLRTFAELRTPGPIDYPWLHTHSGGLHDTQVIFQALTHGDEVGALPALIDVMSRLKSGALTFGGQAHFVLGNPEAALQGQRFLEQDLNRVFVDPERAPGGPDAFEVKRAQTLMPLYDTCALFIDFHQTSSPSKRPFYTGPWRSDWDQWIRAIGGSTAWLARPAGQVYEPNTRCIDEYVRDRGLPGITLELGLLGFDSGAKRRAAVEIERAMALVDGIASGETSLARAAEHEPKPHYFRQTHVEVFSDPMLTLQPGFENFSDVSAGQLVSRQGTPEITITQAATMMHPIYPPRHADGRAVEPLYGAIFRLVQPIEEAPEVAFAVVNNPTTASPDSPSSLDIG